MKTSIGVIVFVCSFVLAMCFIGPVQSPLGQYIAQGITLTMENK
jgi:hypothetical protein